MISIFVSYAHVDNLTPDSTSDGWVSTFINKLQILLAQNLGRQNAYSLWIDDELRGNDAVTPAILQKLDQSDILLLFMSPGYRESTWCQQELQSFLEAHSLTKNLHQKRIFMVTLDKIDTPEAINDLKSYCFWVVKKNKRIARLGTIETRQKENEYSGYLNDLARDLTDQIKKLQSSENTPAISSQQYSKTVYLAQVPQSLLRERESTRRTLQQMKIRVLPETDLPIHDLVPSIVKNLNEAELFIQLLNDDTGQGLPILQYEQCIAVGKPAVQWRPDNIASSSVNETAHDQLLQGDQVIASSLSDFQGMIISKLFPPKPVTKPEIRDSQLFVYIDASKGDVELAQQTSKILDTLNIDYSLPVQTNENISAREIRIDIENNLKYCDAVMMIFRHGPFIQLREHLMLCQRLRAKRNTPMKIIAAFIEPERDPDTLNIKLKELKVFRESPTESVQAFIQAAAK